ncbi:MAG TPA: hypothetical protein VK255_00500 [Patescibacteria group bacterium]|nr:hypothetical protein [Patescibacteria group bacterium]
MARAQAEWSNRISIFFLKKHGYLHKDYSRNSGGIKWTYGMSGSENSIGFAIIRDNWGTPEEKTFIELTYTNTSGWNDEKSDMNYRVELTTTPCNLGGKRYWFICPLSKNGQYCGRRVGVLYGIGKWFGCRHCGEIAYQSQFEGGSFRVGSVCEPDVEKAYNEIKIKYYNGKPTRKYKRYLRLRDRMDDSWIRAMAKFGKVF